MSRKKRLDKRILMSLKEHVLGLLVVFLILAFVFGIIMYFDPYLLTGYQTTEGSDVWSKEFEVEALILFNFSSKGFISANYPVEVTANVQVMNNTLLSFLTGKNYVDMDISGSYAYPIGYGSLGINEGIISLQFDGVHSFRGTSTLIFPYVGNSYFYSIFVYDSPNETPTPIYTMNLTAMGNIPPVFSINEGPAARVQLEQANQNTALNIIAIVLTGLGIVAGIKWTKR